MTNEEWEAVQEGWHRKNLNNLYLKLKKGGSLHLNETERQHLCNALKWVADRDGQCVGLKIRKSRFESWASH